MAVSPPVSKPVLRGLLDGFIRNIDDYIREKAVTTTATKPVMRGLLKASIKRHLFIAFSLAAASGFAYKELVATPRKKAYAEFYKNTDFDKWAEEMAKKGLFQSIPAQVSTSH